MLQEKFPLLKIKINNQKIIYFDNSATTQKPQAVIDCVSNFYQLQNSNVHRSINPLAEMATNSYENSRSIVQGFINAKAKEEIIFTSGATDGLNLIAKTYGKNFLKKGDIVILTEAEHHSNIVPWLQLKKEIGIKIEYIPLTKDFRLNILEAKKILNQKNVKMLSVQQASNVLGTINPIGDLIKICQRKKIISIIDAAQSISHLRIDVQKLGCDFLVFSGHKIFGPTGIGVLYGKKYLLELMPEWKGGGDMIHEVFFDRFTNNILPYKFEAGTPDIAGAIGLGAALEFIQKTGFKKIEQAEISLTKYFLTQILKLNFVKLIGPQETSNRLPVFSIIIHGVHPHDAADLLGGAGVITRAGHHCTQPLHDKFNLPATLRASLSFYNTKEEIDKFVLEIKKIYLKFNQ
ncbi:MAG: SufS family cysteine desulfurase [Candidatus Falkowbacteria bacterium]|nr:SufS family cysteine desulfurase [Candidatus Falkowbacteria bacterium]